MPVAAAYPAAGRITELAPRPGYPGSPCMHARSELGHSRRLRRRRYARSLRRRPGRSVRTGPLDEVSVPRAQPRTATLRPGQRAAVVTQPGIFETNT